MEDSLILVHVIFRHGDRTPDEKALYPKDPHKNFDYSPIGHGQLTNNGKKKAYKLGVLLRERYDKFLGDLYTPRLVDALSSDLDRTKVTLQLVLASLFAPKGEQIWKEELPWQPIPYNYFPQANCKFFLGIHRFKNALGAYSEYLKDSGQQIMEKHLESLQYIQDHTGLIVENPRTLLMLSNTLKTEEDFGLKLPDWTKTLWPDQFEKLAILEFDFLNATNKLKAFSCGKLIDKIVQDSKLKIKGDSKSKLHLYACHEIHIAAVLKSLGFPLDHIPPFCSNVRIELHRVEGVYKFKIYYQRNVDEEAELQKIPGCESYCTFNQFFGQVIDLLEETAVTAYV